jgi:hypothetical protein
MLIAGFLLSVAGCSLIGRAAAPSDPFGDFVVGEFGGIDGRQNILYVRADGVALLVSRAPAAGKLSDRTMSRLQNCSRPGNSVRRWRETPNGNSEHLYRCAPIRSQRR